MNLPILALALTFGSYDGDEVAVSRISAPTLEMDGLVLENVKACMMIGRTGGWQRTNGTFRMLGGWGSFSLLRENGVPHMDCVIKEVDLGKVAIDGVPKIPGRIGELFVSVRGDKIEAWTRDIRIRGDPVKSISLTGDMETGEYKLRVLLFPDGDAIIEGRLLDFFRRLRGLE